jgi:hypothetical protein
MRSATRKAGDLQFCLPETQPLRGLAILLRKVHSRILIRCAGRALRKRANLQPIMWWFVILPLYSTLRLY